MRGFIRWEDLLAKGHYMGRFITGRPLMGYVNESTDGPQDWQTKPVVDVLSCSVAVSVAVRSHSR